MKSVKKSFIRRNLSMLIVSVMIIAQIAVWAAPAAKAEAAAYIRIKNVWQNSYLYEEGNQVRYGDVDASLQNSHWAVVDAGGGMARIQNRATGNYMHIEYQNGTVNTGGIETTWDSAKWFVESLGNSQYRVRSAWQAGSYFHVENLVGYLQYGGIYDAWDSAKWVFEDVSDENPNPTVTPIPTATPVPTAVPDPTEPPVPTETPDPTAAPVPTAVPDPTEPPVPTVIPQPTIIPDPNMNLALNKPAEANGTVHIFYAGNAVDGDVYTYWEGGGYPAELTVDLDGNVDLTTVVLKLNPDSIWGPRTQYVEVIGRADGASGFSVLTAGSYSFNPATQNTVVIPVNGTAAELGVRITSNTGSGSGQIAELEVYGIPAPKPDLTVSNIAVTPSSPYEVDNVIVNVSISNIGTAASMESELSLYANGKLIGKINAPALAPATAVTVPFNTGAWNAGTYEIEVRVNESKAFKELNYNNNSLTVSASVLEVPSSDLTGSVTWTPGNPSNGAPVNFTMQLKNQGNMPTVNKTHTVTLQLKDAQGSTVYQYQGSYTGSLAAGASSAVNMGTWTAVDGSYSITAVISDDENEVSIKKQNNTVNASLYSGRGANVPFTVIEAEALGNNTNGTVLAPNYIIGDLSGEASGRSGVMLDAAGEYVEFTLTQPANAFVLRNAVAENTTGTVSLYVNGVDTADFQVSSKYSYLYASPTTLGRLGYDNTGEKAYWLYEDAQLLLGQVYPAGTTIRIQKDASDVSWIVLDMLEIENVAPAASNPDPARYVEVGPEKSIEQALMDARQDSSKIGIFIPAGEYVITSKIYLYGKALDIVGAGPWHTKLMAPQNGSNNDVGFNISSQANGTKIRDLSAWGNYQYRNDGPGKFIDGDRVQNITVDNVWVEHFVCLYWGVGSSYNTFSNCRIKNMFADGINMTNGSNYNLITNCYARACGDDAFALFSAADAGGSYNIGNEYSNLTAVCTRRAAAFAVYGGSDNLFQNLYGADTLTYPGITISSLSFGYNTMGFGDTDTVFRGVTLDRCGGDFWTSVGADDKINEYQNFGAIWIYSGDRVLQNVLLEDIDINDPVYYGVMVQTMYPNAIDMSNIRMKDITINNPTIYGIKFNVKAENGQGPCLGSASFENVKINNPGSSAVYGLDKCPGFTAVKVGSGNNW